MEITRIAALGACLAVATTATGCSDDGADAGPGTRAGDPGADTAERGTRFFEGRTVRWRRSDAERPAVPVPAGPPPAELEVKVLRRGSGPPVRRGDTAVVNHVGAHYSSGHQHDTTYGPNGLPLEVTPGAKHFIAGFEEGVIGMRVGERRRVIVPPDKGYGDRGYGIGEDRVEPGETLVYVIDLEAVR